MRPTFLAKPFIPQAGAAVLSNVGDAAAARERFLKQRHPNLDYLLFKRYDWMNNYITSSDAGFEVGAGAGFSKLYVHNQNFRLTDYSSDPWIDQKVDAMHLPFPNESADFIIESNVVHHLSRPALFFQEAHRVLRESGVLLIQDVWGSLLLRLLCRLSKAEGYSYDVDVFDEEADCCDPDNLWAGNNVVPNLLFADKERFATKFHFSIEHFSLGECLIFPLSGGVTSTITVPKLPPLFLKLVDWTDAALVKAAPSIFALQMRAVLRKRGRSA